MASAQVETSVANNSPSQDSSRPDDLLNGGMLLLGSNHFLRYCLSSVCVVVVVLYGFVLVFISSWRKCFM